MKTLLLSTLTGFLFLTMTSGAAANGFEKIMGQTLAKYQTCKTSGDYAELSSSFERIARKDTAEWLPKYYQVHTLVIASFMERDPKKKDALLDRAEPAMTALLEMEPDNAEIHVIHGMYYTARLVVDPASRGQRYSMLSGQAVGKASALDSDNPRVKYMRISNAMGQAQFFGQDVSPYCAQAKQALREFDTYSVQSSIHPSWGKDQLQEQASTCDK